jgi:hypothetical protein
LSDPKNPLIANTLLGCIQLHSFQYSALHLCALMNLM